MKRRAFFVGGTPDHGLGRTKKVQRCAFFLLGCTFFLLACAFEAQFALQKPAAAQKRGSVSLSKCIGALFLCSRPLWKSILHFQSAAFHLFGESVDLLGGTFAKKSAATGLESAAEHLFRGSEHLFCAAVGFESETVHKKSAWMDFGSANERLFRGSVRLFWAAMRFESEMLNRRAGELRNEGRLLADFW